MKWTTVLGGMGLAAAAICVVLPWGSTFSAFTDQASTQPLAFRAISLPQSLPLSGRGGVIGPDIPVNYGFVSNNTGRTLSFSVNMAIHLSTAFHRPLSTTKGQAHSTKFSAVASPPQFPPQNRQVSLTLGPGTTDILLFPAPNGLIPGIYQAVVTLNLGGFTESALDTFTMPLPPLPSGVSSKTPSSSSSDSSSSSSTPSSTHNPVSSSTSSSSVSRATPHTSSSLSGSSSPATPPSSSGSLSHVGS